MSAPRNLLKGFEKTVAEVRPDPAKRLMISDPGTRGLYLRVTPNGAKTYTIVARNPQGKQIWREVGPADLVSLDDARAKAKEGVQRIKKGEEPFDEAKPPKTFRDVSLDFLALHVKAIVEVDGKGKVVRDGDGKRIVRNAKHGVPLRSAHEIVRQFDEHFWPAWGDEPFTSVRRKDVAELLDDMEKKGRAGMGDHLLATLSKLANWYAARDEDYVSPIIKGMRRTRPAEQARNRILSDDEIRAVWIEAGKQGVFGAILRTCLLTAQRRDKVRTMRWEDVDLDTGLWTIPAEAREKTNARELTLPPMVLEIISDQKRVEGSPYVFAGRSDGAFNGFSKSKRAFDEKVKIPAWVIHDLRRTAKSLMGRAGVRPDISERVLGHAIPGVEGIYDRYNYAPEKADALKKLAELVKLVLNPPKGNVVRIEERKHG